MGNGKWRIINYHINDMKRSKIRFIIIFLALGCCLVRAQQTITITLTLDRTIALAADSSLEAFRSKNLYMANYWGFRSFKANRLPSVRLNLMPGQYYNTISQRFDSENKIDFFLRQQTLQANAGLSVVQNFDLLGGTFFMNTNLDYLRNLGNVTNTQFSSTFVRIGYQQNLLGFNQFKWDKKIEPLKYEKAKKQLVYDMENIAEQAVAYFFRLAMAQAAYELAAENVDKTETLFLTGEKRYEIAAISQTDLFSLKLEHANAVNSLKRAEIDLKRAMFDLASFLNLDKNTIIHLNIPNYPKDMEISSDKALAEAQSNHPDLMGFEQNILENQRNVDRTKKESMFNATISASVGFNQAAEKFSDVFRDPLRQELVSLSVSIPLIDWGVRKGNLNMAKNNLAIAEIRAQQGEITLEQDVIMTVSDFNIQKDLITLAVEALELAEDIYSKTHQGYLAGREDINSLMRSRQNQQQARRTYISSLESYWSSYYKIRKLTLFDFEYNLPITSTIESRYLFIND
jgi:outer membrane protein TolC